MKAQNKNQIFEVYASYFRKGHTWAASYTDKEILKNVFDILRGQNGELAKIDKTGPLSKHFWIAEGYSAGRSWEEADQIRKEINQNRGEEFLRANTERLEAQIESIEEYINYLSGKINCISYSNLYFFVAETEDTKNPLHYVVSHIRPEEERGQEKYKALTLEDAQNLKTILLNQLADQKKRCQAYLKKYGTSKIYASVYWADR